MLKFFFSLLLLANAALFAYQRGYLEPLLPSGREPGRASRQLNADKIKLIPEPKAVNPPSAAPDTAPAASAATGAASTATPAPAVVATAATAPRLPEVSTCTELGNFNAEDARRFSAQLAALSLGERVTRRDVQGAISHIVYIPPQADKDAAEKKAGELRRLGVNDFYIIQDNSSLRWGISLGVFKLEEAARSYLTTLNQKGVHSARIGQRSAATGLVAFQLHGLDATAKSAVEKIKAGFPKQTLHNCDAA
jgi:hypothetical protein